MSAAYAGFVATGIGVGAAQFVAGWRRAGRRVEWRVTALMAVAVAAALAGARLYALVEQGGRWDLAAAMEGGFRLPGAVVGLLLGLYLGRAVLLPGVAAGEVGDVGAVAAQFGLAVVRLGCLAEGCCFGTVCDLPWAIRFPRGSQAAAVHAALGLVGAEATVSLPVHPLPLYFLLLHLAVALVLLWFTPRKAYDGQVLLLGLLLGQGGKALLESLRQPLPGASTVHLQIASATLAAAAACLLVAIALRGARRGNGYAATAGQRPGTAGQSAPASLRRRTLPAPAAVPHQNQ